MTTTRAVIVHGLVEHLNGLVLAVELGKRAHERVLHDHRNQPLGIGGAARNVDDGGVDALVGQELLHAHRRGVVGARGHPSAVAGAGAERDHRVGLLSGLGQGVDALLAAHHQHVAVVRRRHSTLVYQHVSAGLDGILARLLHGMTGCCGERLGIVERDRLEHELGDIRRIGLRQRLGAARARAAFHPDDRKQLARLLANLQRLRYLRGRRLRKTEHDRQTAAILEKVTTSEPARLQTLRKRSVCSLKLYCHSNTSLFCAGTCAPAPPTWCSTPSCPRRNKAVGASFADLLCCSSGHLYYSFVRIIQVEEIHHTGVTNMQKRAGR